MLFNLAIICLICFFFTSTHTFFSSILKVWDFVLNLLLLIQCVFPKKKNISYITTVQLHYKNDLINRSYSDFIGYLSNILYSTFFFPDSTQDPI